MLNDLGRRVELQVNEGKHLKYKEGERGRTKGGVPAPAGVGIPHSTVIPFSRARIPFNKGIPICEGIQDGQTISFSKVATFNRDIP